jgi:hypothetical protein
MPPAASRLRDRQLKRRTKAQRAQALLDRADTARIEAIQAQLAIAQLEAQPEGERPTDYDDQLTRAQADLALRETKAAAIEAEAVLVLGRPINPVQQAARRKNVLRQQADLIERNLDAWEGTIIDHEANLIESDVVPEEDRDEEWQRRRVTDEQSLEILDRALAVAEAKLAEIKADADFDPSAAPPPVIEE